MVPALPTTRCCEQPRRAAAAALLAAGLAGALVTGPPLTTAASSEPAPAPAGPVVVLPMNVEEVPPEYLADGGEVMDSVLARELAREGVAFEQLSLVEAIRRWTRATAEVGGLVVGLEGVEPASVERARAHFVESLLEEFGASAVLWPDLREREAERDGDTLIWDGVELDIPWEGTSRWRRSPERGSSLRIRIFDAEGERIHDATAGLEVIHVSRLLRRQRVAKGRGERIWSDAPVRTDLFEDYERMAAAVRQALPDELPPEDP